MFKETAIVVDRAGGWTTLVEIPVRHLDMVFEEKEERNYEAVERRGVG